MVLLSFSSRSLYLFLIVELHRYVTLLNYSRRLFSNYCRRNDRRYQSIYIYIYMQIKDLHINFDGFDHKR